MNYGSQVDMTDSELLTPISYDFELKDKKINFKRPDESHLGDIFFKDSKNKKPIDFKGVMPSSENTQLLKQLSDIFEGADVTIVKIEDDKDNVEGKNKYRLYDLLDLFPAPVIQDIINKKCWVAKLRHRVIDNYSLYGFDVEGGFLLEDVGENSFKAINPENGITWTSSLEGSDLDARCNVELLCDHYMVIFTTNDEVVIQK